MKNRVMVLGFAGVLAISMAVPALGGPSNPIANSAQSAKAIATKALKKAKAANLKAQNAQVSADTAQASADAAQASANSAQSSATAANNNANTKYAVVNFQAGTSSGNTNATKVATESCPSGDRSVGGGYTIGGSPGSDVFVNIDQPYGNASWIVNATDLGGSAGTWALTVSVNCIST